MNLLQNDRTTIRFLVMSSFRKEAVFALAKTEDLNNFYPWISNFKSTNFYKQSLIEK